MRQSSLASYNVNNSLVILLIDNANINRTQDPAVFVFVCKIIQSTKNLCMHFVHLLPFRLFLATCMSIVAQLYHMNVSHATMQIIFQVVQYLIKKKGLCIRCCQGKISYMYLQLG